MQPENVKIPPICLRSATAQRFIDAKHPYWAKIAKDEFTITGIEETGNPTNPLLKVRSIKQQAIEREILLDHVESANGITLPTADTLMSVFA